MLASGPISLFLTSCGPVVMRVSSISRVSVVPVVLPFVFIPVRARGGVRCSSGRHRRSCMRRYGKLCVRVDRGVVGIRRSRTHSIGCRRGRTMGCRRVCRSRRCWRAHGGWGRGQWARCVTAALKVRRRRAARAPVISRVRPRCSSIRLGRIWG